MPLAAVKNFSIITKALNTPAEKEDDTKYWIYDLDPERAHEIGPVLSME